MPFKREIIYPFFLECCCHADDVFWENIFEDFAYGKTPYGTYINKGFFCCGYKNKEFSYKIERKESKVLYDEIYKLLTEKLGILSYKEKSKQRLDFHELEKTIKGSHKNWNNIRKKNIKDIMFERFAIDMKREYSLSQKQCKHLLSIILLAIIFKTITSKDIVYQEDKIQSINGISFSNGKVYINEDIHKIPIVQIESTEQISEKIKDNWNKYIAFLRS
jgi:hypothetical protein